ncbi:acyl-CoA thioesterase [Specibacter cremeus]|uniref:acyl-CoA thioesterase n=1 Tax=Specibacter cremeus TaxID=1629051 RepID=UPI000F79678A|nr:thioesterase family protein [Specibacter cremeus]
MATAIQIPLQVRFGDIDAYGHVNNVVFLQYLEDARVQLTHTPLGDSAGPGTDATGTFQRLLDADTFTLVARHEIEYLHPIEFRPAPVFANIWVTRIGGSSFDFGCTVAERDGATVYAQASTAMVLVSRSTGRPVRLTDAQRHALATWLGDDVPFRRRPAAAAAVVPALEGVC